MTARKLPNADGHFQCCQCLMWLPLSEFTKATDRPHGVRYLCKPCRTIRLRAYRALPGQKEKRLEYTRKHYAKYEEKYKYLSRKNHLARNYRITPEEYDRLFKKQKGLCAICKRAQKGKRLAVDHNHDTGKVRGLLCGYCNPKLPILEYYGREAIAYLKKYR